MADSRADRLSALPDVIRELVLSFLPTHDAVRTTVLARSWRDLWMRSLALHITGGWGSPDKFAQFVDRLLRLRLSAPHAPLDSCHFEFDTCDLDPDANPGDNRIGDDHEKLMDHWMQCALRCQVRVLRFCLLREAEFGMLPSVPDLSLDVSEHLSKLELVGVVVSTFNDNLDLSSCPTLQYLKMENCELYLDKISAPYLKHLMVAVCDFCCTSRTLIHLQGLISLNFTECSGRTPFFASMPSLATATIRLAAFGGCDDACSLWSIDGSSHYACRGCPNYYRLGIVGTKGCLLSGLSEAINLELSAYPELVIFIRDLKFARTFSKLKILVLADWFVADGFSALIWFLHHSPILEKFTLQISEVHENPTTTEGMSCKLPEPSVASSHLKIVEIIIHVVDGIFVEILKILNAVGVPSEKIDIRFITGQAVLI